MHVWFPLNVMPPSVPGWSIEGPMSRAIPCIGPNGFVGGEAFDLRMFAVSQ